MDSVELDPDTAWKSLSLVTDWIRHAEIKAGAALAASGVAAGVLYNVTKDVMTWTGPTATAVTVCVILLVAAAACSGAALRPRLRTGLPGKSHLYYRDIASAHPKVPNGAATYVSALQGLAMDKSNVVAEVAAQVWANAHVATRKYAWVTWAINALLGGLAALTIVVLLLARQP